MKFFLTTSFDKFPGISKFPERVTLSIPPVVLNGGKIDLDLSSLIVADGILLDSSSLDWLKEHQIYRGLVETIHVLQEEGFAEVSKYSSYVDTGIDRIVKATEHELTNPLIWLPALRHMIDEWRSAQRIFRTVLLDAYDPVIIGSDFGILHALSDSGEKISQNSIQRAEKLVRSNKKRWTNSEKDFLREMLRPYIYETHVNIVLRRQMRIPFFDWTTLEKFYELKFRHSLLEDDVCKSKEQLAAQQAKQLLHLALPDLAPKNAKQLVKILRDKRRLALVQMIEESIHSGRQFDEGFATQLWMELAVEQKSVIKKGKLSAWAYRAASIFPFGNLLIGMAADAAIEVTSMAHDRSRGKPLKEYEWLYCLIDAKQSAKTK